MAEGRGGWVRWWVVGVLAFVYAMNIADRYVVSTVLEPIRRDLHLTDSGIALLTGVSLALFYVTIGIPISAWADKTNRRNIIAGALVIWSIMTVFCGLARNFAQMMAARIGVGVGEAGGTPPSASILSDLFTPIERPMAMTVYTLGAPVGAWLGAELAGWLADAYGWRAAFFGLGAPGVLAGLLIFLTVREPRRGALDPAAVVTQAPLMQTLGFLFRQRSAVHLMIAGAITTLWGWGLIWWTPAFLMRAYGLSTGAAGGLLGPMHLVAGSLATIATGWIMARPAMARPTRILQLMTLAVGLSAIPSIVAYATHDLGVATLCLWLFIPALYFYIGPSFGLLQNLAPPHMRATAIAVTLFLANIANLVIAPQVVGLISDAHAGAAGADAESLRFALLLLAPTGLWAAVHYWIAIRHFESDESRALGLAQAAAAQPALS